LSGSRYVSDAFTLHPDSALAAVSRLCSLVRLGFPPVALVMYTTLSSLWDGTLLASLAVVIGRPAPSVV
jgi:hypothetical protein